MRDISAFPTVIAVVLLAGGLAACTAQSTSTPSASPATSASPAVSAAVVNRPVRPPVRPGPVIPWVNRPARQDNATMTTPPYTTGARPCTPADLSVWPGSNGATAGTARLQVLFTNRSSTTCWLNGYPTSVAGIAGSGAVHTAARMARWPANRRRPDSEHRLRPVGRNGPIRRRRLHRGPQWPAPDLPAPAIRPPRRRARNHHGDRDRQRGRLRTECGLGVSEFGVPADLPVSPAPSPLTATITAPSAARAGTTFSYRVTLNNPASKPFALSHCPSYVEYLGGAGGNVTRYFYLNCAAAPSIPAHGSVTFQMKLAVPASMKSMSSAKLDWQIQGGTARAGDSHSSRSVKGRLSGSWSRRERRFP